ncbi:MAG: hypothetical protein WBA77_00680 [Microcoleaceae cyanobacterium]
MLEFNQLPGWQYQAGEGSITMIAPDKKCAESYLWELERHPCHCIKWDEPIELFIKYVNGSHRYRVPLTSHAGEPNVENNSETNMKIETQVNPITLQPDSDYQRLMEWMLEKRTDGLSVVVTSQIDDKCLFHNDVLKASRTVLTAAEFIGQNYRWYWRDTMDDYRELRDRLDAITGDRDYLAGFEYRLRRPDGALCSYSTDYYRATFLGVPVRIGVSRSEDWQIIETAYR